ncbi:ImcF-related family protein [Cupriavidus sp. UYPR2.512]|uniref:ImcF-related family protein n=1 Tax=Cupriavidus sp. UYPR2.512 TaxID=1080187 RepID=UPI00068636D5|nr:ImcF-related family protein [Cupriavidus sp. UYPR2.512]UIF91548.1 type VI secretion protein VasK [Cupriavidus necator]
MTNPSTDLKAETANSKTPGAISLWGGPLVLAGTGALAALVVWFHGESFGLISRDARMSVLLWIPLVVIFAILVYLVSVLLGADRATARLFAREAGDARSPWGRRPRRDTRLEELRHDLRSSLGWRWRSRMPWLMLCGDDASIDEVAPGLKQAGVWRSEEAVLVHASPAGSEAATWLRQVRKLRYRCPVDAMVQVVSGNNAGAAHTQALRALAATQGELGWAAPVIFVHPVTLQGAHRGEFTAIGAFLDEASHRTRGAAANAMDDLLVSLEARTAVLGVQWCAEPRKSPFIARISAYIGEHRAGIVNRWAAWHASAWRRAPMAGVMFAPVFAAPSMPVPVPAADASAEVASLAAAIHGPEAAGMQLVTLLATWREIGERAANYRARRIGIHPLTVLTLVALVSVAFWSAGMLASGLRNTQDLRTARQTIQDMQTASTPAARLKALLALQQQIERFEYRTQHYAPLLTRFGLNRDPEVLAVLWKPYAQASRQLLVTPVQEALEASLTDLAQMRTDSLDEQTSRWALEGHQGLKTYLMLAYPERADAAFLAPQLAQHWSTDARITPGERQDLAGRLLNFYANHLKANPGWHIQPRPELVAGARQTLLAVIGQRNAEETIYQGILTAFGELGGSKYPDQSLASLTAGTDPRGLLRSAAIVPAVFTRQAYEGYVAPAIETAATRSEIASDWVLADDKVQANAAIHRTAQTLQAALTEQYFSDYADRWQGFMNSLQWEPAPTLPTAIDQLKLMADARQSPVMALMKALEYQGGAGARKESLSDTLVEKAQNLLGKPAEPGAIKPDPAGPLGTAFAPVLRLMGQGQSANPGANGDMSLQRFLDRATALRLRLQQVSNSADADAQSRQMAQALFQGKGSELADTQAYAQLMAASLGSQWAGMGETLFVRPIAQATQTVLQPAQASLNDSWRQSIAMTWGRAFAGRYPFADSTEDASLPELARFLRPQSGLIGAFLGTQLAGVLELRGDQWVPAATSGQAMAFDPAFLRAVNTLQRIAAHLLAQGQPGYRFEFQPVPTPGLTDTLLTVDGQKLHYYNQREIWQAMTWPGNSPQDLGTHLQWRTEKAGLNKSYEFGGRWGLVRMLERAHIEPLSSATYQLTWQAVPDTLAPIADPGETDPDSLTARAAKLAAAGDMIYPIRYQMRTEIGQGPLEMLALRGFVLPGRIFAAREPQAPVPAAPPQRR